MSLRFPHRSAGGDSTAPGSRVVPNPAGATVGWLDGPETVPGQACCCPAKPQVKVIMPGSATRPQAVDLWLCGHHWRESGQALAGAGAAVYHLSPPELPARADRETAPA